MKNLLTFGILLFGLLELNADVPANCTYEDARGEWIFTVGERIPHPSLGQQPMSPKKVFYKLNVKLLYPDLALDQFGNSGFWTMIFNQGFEVVVGNRKYFSFFRYKQLSPKTVISICNETVPGFTHDVLVRQWAHFVAVKKSSSSPKLSYLTNLKDDVKRYYKPNIGFINKINSIQSDWKARHYPQFEGKTLKELTQMRGVSLSKSGHIRPKPAVISLQLKLAARTLPKAFDWRNVSGMNYVSPIRNQGHCGSCYSFASAAMLEARFRIRTANKYKPIISPQDVVECSPYSQGCSGGFPYLIAGKYAEDFGLALEACNSYKGKDGKCTTKANCTRVYATKYRYVGGYYGACNELQMIRALVQGGPLAVGFEVYSDFMHYSGGIYHHTGLTDKFNPLENTNHAVLIVGYGQDSKGRKYWTVKNSWGPQWGEAGFFRISRGNDECAMESMAMSAEPVL